MNLHAKAQHPINMIIKTIPMRITDESRTVRSIGFQQFLAEMIGEISSPYLIASARSLKGVAMSISRSPSYRIHSLLTVKFQACFVEPMTP